ncbi:uncharacterized protein LOC141712619 [Apium graveolens]|uniref:uncharacterized protein LOC141712619 n=1 Tax=Apium graveolens TaxID=4045 RepID=UPI003D7A3C6E
MSSYENVVGGRLKLKGKALDVKAGGLKKKKMKHSKSVTDKVSEVISNEALSGGNADLTDQYQEDMDDVQKFDGDKNAAPHIESLTPAERRYMEQRQKIDEHKLAKVANKSHRDRISDFNQYLANMSEHYDIPKVGPG